MKFNESPSNANIDTGSQKKPHGNFLKSVRKVFGPIILAGASAVSSHAQAQKAPENIIQETPTITSVVDAQHNGEAAVTMSETSPEDLSNLLSSITELEAFFNDQHYIVETTMKTSREQEKNLHNRFSKFEEAYRSFGDQALLTESESLLTQLKTVVETINKGHADISDIRAGQQIVATLKGITSGYLETSTKESD